MPTATRTVSLEEMTLRQLRRIASSYRVSRYSRMRKSQLVAAIESIEEQQQGVDLAPRRFEAQEEVGAAKFNLGQASTSEDNLVLLDESLED
ncbi:MAG: Rho termination factor N-terminal domain-containing protein, partial [Prochlorotrichaceae cyanobacterium]